MPIKSSVVLLETQKFSLYGDKYFLSYKTVYKYHFICLEAFAIYKIYFREKKREQLA